MREQFAEALKDALKARDVRRTSTVRLIQAAIKDRDIANRGAGKDPVDDDDIKQILAKMIKQREESAKLRGERPSRTRRAGARGDRGHQRLPAGAARRRRSGGFAPTLSAKPARRACATWESA